MTIISSGSVLGIDVLMTLLGSTVMNRLTYEMQNEADSEDIVTDFSIRLGEIYDTFVGFQCPELVYTGYRIKVVLTDVLVGEGAWGGTTNGGAAGDAYAPGVAALITKPTLTPKVRGRTFVPGLSEAHVTDGLLDAGSLAALVDMATLLFNAFEGEASLIDYIPGVLSLASEVFHRFDSASVTNVPAYQRRRKQGVGI